MAPLGDCEPGPGLCRPSFKLTSDFVGVRTFQANSRLELLVAGGTGCLQGAVENPERSGRVPLMDQVPCVFELDAGATRGVLEPLCELQRLGQDACTLLSPAQGVEQRGPPQQQIDPFGALDQTRQAEHPSKQPRGVCDERLVLETLEGLRHMGTCVAAPSGTQEVLARLEGSGAAFGRASSAFRLSSCARAENAW